MYQVPGEMFAIILINVSGESKFCIEHVICNVTLRELCGASEKPFVI